MINSKPSGSAAFQWLDNHLIDALETPDESLDWIFMLRTDDWPLFAQVWDQRPPVWREACAYVLGELHVPQAQEILRLAVNDHDQSVAMQAASSLCYQVIKHPEQCPFDRTLLPRLRELRDLWVGDSSEIDLILSRFAVGD